MSNSDDPIVRILRLAYRRGAAIQKAREENSEMKPIEQIVKEYSETLNIEQFRRDLQEWRNHLAELGVQVTMAVEQIAELEKQIEALNGKKIDTGDDDPNGSSS